MEYDTVPRGTVTGKQRAKRVAFGVGEMLFTQQGIGKRQPRRYAVLPGQLQYFARIVITEANAPAAPETIRGGAVQRTDIAPIVKVLAMLEKKRKKDAI